MPSTCKQKTREKRSRQADVLSDMENLAVIGSHPRNETENLLSEDEENSDRGSNERQTNIKPNEKDYRTLLTINSRGSSEMTAETVRVISSEITSQVE